MNIDIPLKTQVAQLQDRSKYFLGLLILTAMDGVIQPEEKRKLCEVAQLLDFEPEYYNEAIDNILENTHVKREAIQFSSISVARAFLEDGLRLALVDDDLASHEIEWLETIALANKIPESWLELIGKFVNLNMVHTPWSVSQWWPVSKKNLTHCA